MLETVDLSAHLDKEEFDRQKEALHNEVLRTHMFYPPTEEEKRYPFHRRYWAELPARGDVAVFVRSWYYHLMEGQVRTRRPTFSAAEVIDEVRAFEQMLAEDRYLIVKFFLHIDGKTQKKRRRKDRRG